MKANVEEDVKKKKSLALKSTQVQEDSETEAELNDEEFAYLTKKFKMHFRKRNFSKKVNNQEGKGEKSNRDTIIYYECKKPGHVKWDCPQRKAISKKKRKAISKKNKKAMKATWDESDESESKSEEEVANLCVMAFGDDDDDNDEPCQDPSPFIVTIVGVMANSKEPRCHKCGKHIEHKYHLIREIVH
ncbi:uncharacterized protein LOC120076181 [Benincasa hispida]|uniref:uncharacterized protein LOC120076181 n=1 Tax=Benincasa hispida TaxID=102211 RepID=UPI00190058B8|nr:uncharacterized protein LOC120076181 [Benincasa hispida]